MNKFVFGQYFESIEIMLKWISKQKISNVFLVHIEILKCIDSKSIDKRKDLTILHPNLVIFMLIQPTMNSATKVVSNFSEINLIVNGVSMILYSCGGKIATDPKEIVYLSNYQIHVREYCQNFAAFKCSKCKTILYRSKDWPNHKFKCK